MARRKWTGILFMLLAAGLAPSAHTAEGAAVSSTYHITKRDIPEQYLRPYQFLESLKMPHEPTGVFSAANAPYWDISSVMAFISKRGVTFSDVNGSSPGHVTKDVITRALESRTGSIFTAFAHISHIYSIPYSQYSALSFEDIPDGVVVHMAGWYDFTFKIEEGGLLQLIQIDYLELEGG